MWLLVLKKVFSKEEACEIYDYQLNVSLDSVVKF